MNIVIFMARKTDFNPNIILDKAMQLFWLKGYEATSIDDLCSEMGIKRGSLYNSFGSKRDLFFSALKHYSQSNNPSAKQPIQSGLHAIRKMFQEAVDESTSGETYRGCLIVNTITELAAVDSEVAEYAESQRLRYEKMVHDFLVIAEEDGEIAPNQDLEKLAQYLVSALYGLRVTAKVNHDRDMLENIVNVTLSVLG